MAIIIPYGDTNAHGSIGKSVTFRRFRNTVVFQKKPHPRDKNTAAQQVQRQKFKNGWADWQGLDLWEVQYINNKAAAAGTYPQNWYLSQYLKDITPSTNANRQIKQVTDMDLPEVSQAENQAIKITVQSYMDAGPVILDMGHIFDYENIATPGEPMALMDIVRLSIKLIEISAADIPFDYPVLVYYNNFADEAKESLIRLPAMHIEMTGSTDLVDMVWGIIQVEVFESLGSPGSGAVFDWGCYELDYDPFLSFGTHDGVAGVKTLFPSFGFDFYDFAIKVTGQVGTGSSIPPDWRLEVTYIKEAEGEEFVLDIYLGNIFIPAGVTYTWYISDDGSLWWDKERTDIFWSIENSESFLYLATDFSVYYDRALTQIANTPYFGPGD